MFLLNKIYFLTTCEHTWSTIYLYAWKPNRTCSWMLGHIHALMIVLKFEGNWTARYMCTLRFKCSCASLFTFFVDLVLTCVLALTIICSHVYFLRWLQAFTFTSFEIHILLCTHTLLIIHFYVHMLWLSYAPISTCFEENLFTCLYALMLVYLDTSMIGCSYVNVLLWWSHVSIVICSHAYMI